ncbi:MAG TPA: phosphoglucosamine mutase [Acidimicrobiales bacterium]|nr:phosphoglucosamine mutase [Acidimicrobiales bacterium]
MTLRFGTDGVRGRVGDELTPELVLALGRAAARVLGGDRFLVGRDPRRSGPLLEGALTAGLAAEGATVERLGVLPTPAVAALAAAEGVPGAVISASHNAWVDNGVKLFGAGGRKLDDAAEARLEAELDRPAAPRSGEAIGAVVDRADAAAGYVDRLVGTLDGRRLDGLSVVLDCANGAASAVGPTALRRLGADVDVIAADPDGRNINDGCGSTAPGALAERVLAVGADAGLAVDGDADRVVAVDAQGRVVDGDHLMAVCALDLAERGLLAERTVVVTVMTNLGFRLAMAEHDVRVVETPVGDRYVLEALESGRWSLGGEQSGHVIFRDLATTGDGLLTGIQVLDAVRRSGRSLGDLAAVMRSLPQVLRNVPVARRGLDVGAVLAGEVAAEEARLGQGRVLLRPSGTEPVVRVMVEAGTAEEAEAAAARLADAVARLST